MYWTRTNHPNNVTVFTAGMDGVNPKSLVSGFRAATGIQIDFEMRRLYWSDFGNMRILSSNLDGSGIVTIHQLAQNPLGIALVDARL